MKPLVGDEAGTRGGDAATTLSVPLDDPISALPPTAQAILAAARDVLLSEGVTGLTVAAVTKRAGANQAAVSYYFGGKSGLMAAVVDATIHDACVQLLETTRELPPGAARREYFIAAKRQISENDEAYRALFAVLPYALGDARLRETLCAAYDWYRRVNRDSLGIDDALGPRDTEALMRLVTAVVDGLAIQRTLAGGDLDLGHSFALFGRMVSLMLAELGEQTDGDRAAC